MAENIGKVIKVSGPAVDIQFEGATMPPIYQALRVTSKGFPEASHCCRVLLAAIALFACCVSRAAAQNAQDLYRLSPGQFANHMEYHDINLDPGKETELANLAGPGIVTYFYITDNSYTESSAKQANESGELYPGLVLKIYWDYEKEPSVWVPLWDFFGALDKTPIDYQSSLLQLNHQCFMSHMPMPFSRRARFVLANDGNVRYSQSVAYGIDYEKNADYATEKSRFHSTWRRSNPTDGLHTILDVHGSGHYVGNFLQVFTRYTGWWGEGDTIFYLDGKMMTHTPGTEDEYGSCWGFQHTFSYSYAGHIQNEAGKNRMYRWYVTNPVRFQKSLKVVIQNQHWEGGQIPSNDDYTSVAYWYQDGAHPAPVLQSFAERTELTRAVSYTK
jgi:hypothetical protein